MSDRSFDEVIAASKGRLVVMFRRAPNGDEQFQWGIQGTMPIMTLLGFISRVQVEMMHPTLDDYHGGVCPQQALALVWDGIAFDWFVHEDIPTDALLGMLETIKSALIGGRISQHAASQRVQLVGIDGKPMRG